MAEDKDTKANNKVTVPVVDNIKTDGPEYVRLVSRISSLWAEAKTKAIR